MFCDNCGAPMQEGQSFCGKCGHGSKKAENSLCQSCGAELSAEARFCNVCGAAVEEKKKRFCQFCGTEMSEDVQFCINCGKKASTKSFISASLSSNKNTSESAGWFGGRFKNQFTDTVDGFIKKVSDKLTDITSSFGGELADRRAASLGWKHALVTVLILLIVVVYYLPIMKISVPSVYGSYYNLKVNLETAGVAIGNPFSQVLQYESASDLESFNTIVIICVLLFDIIPLLLTALFTFLPCLKGKILKGRRMIFQMIMSFRVLLTALLYRIIGGAAINSAMENYKEYEDLLKEYDAMPRINLTFWGCLLIILAVALIVTLFVIKKENKATMQEIDEAK